jgi:hypothetical protein
MGVRTFPHANPKQRMKYPDSVARMVLCTRNALPAHRMVKSVVESFRAGLGGLVWWKREWVEERTVRLC